MECCLMHTCDYLKILIDRQLNALFIRSGGGYTLDLRTIMGHKCVLRSNAFHYIDSPSAACDSYCPAIVWHRLHFLLGSWKSLIEVLSE